MRTILLVALVLLPACVFPSGGNKAATRDVEKPTGETRVPESQFATVPFDASGLTPPLYETPSDRVLVIHDLRVTAPCDVVAEIVGAPLVLLPWNLFEAAGTGTQTMSFLVFHSASGVRVPANSKLRLQRSATDPKAAEVSVFFSGELVRL